MCFFHIRLILWIFTIYIYRHIYNNKQYETCTTWNIAVIYYRLSIRIIDGFSIAQMELRIIRKSRKIKKIRVPAFLYYYSLDKNKRPIHWLIILCLYFLTLTHWFVDYIFYLLPVAGILLLKANKLNLLENLGIHILYENFKITIKCQWMRVSSHIMLAAMYKITFQILNKS